MRCRWTFIRLVAAAALLAASGLCGAAADHIDRIPNAYFGDLHVHTQYSFDAYIYGIRTGPEDAYRYARGEPLPHPDGGEIRLRGAPLDFLAVTDHSEYLGVTPLLGDPDHPLGRTDLAADVGSDDIARVMRGHRQITRAITTGIPDPDLDDRAVVRATWQRIIDAAAQHYEPGRFTTFVGFEFTPHRHANLHRNVIFRGSQVPEQPFGALESLNPEDLWQWMDALRQRGIESLAIPHNANWSNGRMFSLADYAGAPLTAEQAAQRVRLEPLMEISQSKGTSETHPLLSPDDEWAGFEIFGDKAMHLSNVSDDADIRLDGSYARPALLAGLAFEQRRGVNPFRLGFIGSSDTHNTGASYDEDDYRGKLGRYDGDPVRRIAALPPGAERWEELDALLPTLALSPQVINWSSAGLAGVWAVENTREALFDAMRRRETFGTSGPRIRVRFFAGYGLREAALDAPGGLAWLYRQATPMGGELAPGGDRAPDFLVWAARDPASVRLQRIQIIKGWVDGDETHERVFDVVCADGLTPDALTQRCPDNGATVDLADCTPTRNRGAPELRGAWRDPAFDPAQPAFYYVRVLENPTCRWSTWDALRAGSPANPSVSPTIQERAWSSPIWYSPD